jgi:hypothetical protein
MVCEKSPIFSRKDIVLLLANKDGGAHIDGEIDDRYVDIKYNNSIGRMFFDGIIEYSFPDNAAYVSARQIAHEFLVPYNYYTKIKSSSITVSKAIEKLLNHRQGDGSFVLMCQLHKIFAKLNSLHT